MSKLLLQKLISPKWFYNYAGKCLPLIVTITIFLIPTGWIWGIFFTPPDYLQGHSYRIIFVHVPAAQMALMIYVCIAIAGIIGFIWRIKLAFLASRSLTAIGTSFCLLAIISGSFWGKPTWGTWWVWDARLTSMLILFFLYIGQTALRQAIINRSQADRAVAILAMVGLVNLPIIKYSVQWWNTLHQGSSITLKNTSIDSVMLYPLLVSIVGFASFCLLIFLIRMRAEILNLEYRTRWVRMM